MLHDFWDISETFSLKSEKLDETSRNNDLFRELWKTRWNKKNGIKPINPGNNQKNPPENPKYRPGGLNERT